MELETTWFAATTPLARGFVVAKQVEGRSPHTLADCRRALGHFSRWHGDRDPRALGPADLRAFRAEERQRRSPNTVYNTWVALRSFYRWLAAEMGQPNPALALAAPKITAPLIEPLGREQIAALLRAAESARPAGTRGSAPFVRGRPEAARDRALLLTLLDTGLRASELGALTLGDLDLASGGLLVRQG